MARLPVMIVDDDKGLREALRNFLQSNGFSTIEAEDGGSALETLTQQPVSLIISDIQLPSLDGLSLLREVKKSSDAPFILMTGFSRHTPLEAFDLGASAFLEKPFSPKRIKDVIQKSLLPKTTRWRNPVGVNLNQTFPMYFRAPSLAYAFESKILNIGQGGFFAALNDTPPPVGTIITFEIEFQDSKRSALRGTGIVQWVRPKDQGQLSRGFGVEFVSLDNGCYEAVLEHINRVGSNSYIPER
jgi:CheY-like chemotaxis protein